MDDFDSYELDVLRSSLNDSNKLAFGDDFLICECKCVSYKEIKEYLTKEIDFEFLTKEFGLGSGCKSCIEILKSMNVNKL